MKNDAPFRVAIVTSVRNGNASWCLPALLASPRIQVAGVIVSAGAPSSKWAHWKRKLIKTWRIGLPGAINGIRMRPWFIDPQAEDIADVCQRLNVPVIETEKTNSDPTRNALRDLNVDLALSLGNTYLGKKLFGIPRHGMINVHEEILPAFQGAQSIIWPIHEGVRETGFTIHQVDEQIDTGRILLQQRFPIEFHSTLQETVVRNLATCRRLIPAAVTMVCEDFPAALRSSTLQARGRSFTTPSIWQFLAMQRKHSQFWHEQTQSRESSSAPEEAAAAVRRASA
jgi:methionyl-tRNA formyltransferase